MPSPHYHEGAHSICGLHAIHTNILLTKAIGGEDMYLNQSKTYTTITIMWGEIGRK